MICSSRVHVNITKLKYLSRWSEIWTVQWIGRWTNLCCSARANCGGGRSRLSRWVTWTTSLLNTACQIAICSETPTCSISLIVHEATYENKTKAVRWKWLVLWKKTTGVTGVHATVVNTSLTTLMISKWTL